MAKYDVVVYLGTLPRIKNHDRKVEILTNFAHGAERCGARVAITSDKVIQDCNLAVMIGWYGQKISGQHIQFRKQLIEHQLAHGKHIMPIDGNCFKWADPNDAWLRYSLDSVYWNEGNYANLSPTKHQWRHIKKQLSIDCLPWQESGNHILLCLQRDNGWQGKGFDQQSWVAQTIKTLQRYTDRPIRLRCHPGAISGYVNDFTREANVTVSNCLQTGIMEDLQNAHAGVFYNSSSSVACALAGVPVFASEPSAVTWDIANKDLTQIESPQRPDRTQWLWSVADAHWSTAQSRNGEIYDKYKNLYFLP